MTAETKEKAQEREQALELLATLAAGQMLHDGEWTRAMIAALAQPAASARPADSASEPRDPTTWHGFQLTRLLDEFGADKTDAAQAKARFHARMLGFALAPARPEFKPLVTVLIPVFNRAGPLVEAVQSGIDQTWRPIEILVVDDGSTDDPAAALAPLGDQVRVIRKQNGGVASARNLGMHEARGDFVHFLDSDDLLLPRAIESKIEVYGTHPDAELCYGQAQGMDMRKSPPILREARITALDNPFRSMIVAFPFLLQQVMMPRWRALAAAPFEEDLRRSSDFRFWQSLAFAGIKVAGSQEVTTRLRRFHDSLHLTPERQDDSHAVALLRGLRDLFGHTASWPYGIDYVNILAAERARYWFEAARSDRVQHALSEVSTAISECRSGAVGGLSALPLLAALRERIGAFARRGEWPTESAASAYAMLSEALGQAIKGCSPITDRDLAFWTGEPSSPSVSPELHGFFDTLRTGNAGRAGLVLADRLLRNTPRIPGRKQVKRAMRLLPFLGPSMAERVAGWWMRQPPS